MRPIMLLLLGVLLFACKKEPTSWENRIESPLVQGTLALADLLPSESVDTDEDGTMRLVKEDTLIQLPLDSLLQLPDTTLRHSYIAPIGGVDVDPGQTLIDQDQVQELGIPKAELTRVTLDQGKLEYKITSTLPEYIEYRYRVPVVEKNGQVLEIERTVPPGTQSDPSQVSGSKDLKGYDMDLSGPNGGEVNRFATELEARTIPSGDTIQLDANDSITSENRFIGLNPSYAKGYFGQHQRELPYREISLGLFEKVRSGELDIDSVTVTLTLDNGIGMDARIRIPTLRAIGVNGEKDLDHSIIGEPINLARAQSTNGSMDHTVRKEVMTPQNSNIDRFLEVLPQDIGYELDLRANPLGDVSNGNDIMMKGHDVHARMRIELPLSLIADDLTLVDTLGWDPGGERNSEVQEGTLFLDVDNGFPLSAELSAFFHGPDGELLGTLLEDRTVPAAATDASWNVTERRQNRIRIPVSPSSAKAFRNAERISILARFNTPQGSSHIELYDHYELDFRLSGELNFKNRIE